MKAIGSTVMLCLGLLLGSWPTQTFGQTRTIIRDGVPIQVPINAPTGMESAPPSSGRPNAAAGDSSGPWIPSEPLSASVTSTNQDSSKTNVTDEVQLSFQGANIEMVVQWLAQTTGKSVVKHPQVNVQMTINSSKKLKQREAVNLVFRALALEGFSAIEFSKSILIVPEGKEPKMSPELLDAAQEVPEGRQRLVKVFPLEHIQAADLRERIRTALSDKATIDIDERANQIIITDYNDNIRSVGALIETLDNEKPEDVAVRVLPLKNVAAVELARAIVPLYQKRNTKSLKDTVEVTADERSNSLLILSSEANFRAIQQFVKGVDTEDAQEKTTRTFTLKNADAQDVAKQLQDLNDEQTSSSRYIYYYSSPTPKTGKKMKVVADRRRNALVVQAAPTEMEGIARMIEQLDEPVDDGSLAPRMFQLKYVSAVDIEEVLNELFLKKSQQRTYWDMYSDSYSSTSTDRDVGRLYGKVRITSEPNSNTLIVTANSKENLAVVEEVLQQLDVPSTAGDSTLRVSLKFAKAYTLANQLNVLFAKNGSPAIRATPQQNQPGGQGFQQQQQQQQNNSSQSGFDLELEAKEEGYFPWLGGQPDAARGGSTDRAATRPVSDLVGRVRAVADHRGNAVLVSANVHYFPQILKLIDQMDSPSDQVLIEARIVEVSTDYLDKLGVRYSPDGSKVFTADDYDNSLFASTTARYMQGFGDVTKVNSPDSSDVAQAITSLRSGVVGGTISMDFLVQFLRKTTDATVLGNPQINVRDNETGRLFVGQQIPIQTESQDSANGLRQSFVYKNVGVILEVTPHINSAGDVELKIHAESSTVVPGVTVLGGAVFDTRTLRTDLRARDGQTLVLGGIIQRQISDTLRTTPYLGAIPVIGWAFKKKDKTTREVELMIFLRPKIVRSELDAQELMQELFEKAPLIKKSEEESQLKTEELKGLSNESVDKSAK